MTDPNPAQTPVPRERNALSGATRVLKDGEKAFFANPPDFQTAKDCFLQVTISAPNWVEGYHWLASALEEMEDYRGAARAYREAIRCDAKDPRPRIALGRLLTFMGQLEEAILELQRGVALKPHYCEPDARLFLAEAYEKANLFSAAIEQWRIVEKMKPSYPSYEEPIQEASRKLQTYSKPQT